MYNDRQIKRGGFPAQRKSTALASKAHAREDSPLFKTVLFSSLLGVAVNAVAGLILLSLVCFVAISGNDPLSLIAPLSLLALFPSNFLGGFVSTKRTGESPLACGIVTAAIWGVISLIVSLCMYNVQPSGYALWQGLMLHAVSALFCILGAFAGNYKPRRNPKRNRRFGR